MKKPFYTIAVLLFVAFTMSNNLLHAQQKVSYGEKTFGRCEVTEAAIGNSGQKLSFYIAEHELRAGYGGKYERETGRTPEMDNLNDVPTGYSILLEVYFKDGFKFPIEPKDSVFVSFSSIQYAAEEKKEYDRLSGDKVKQENNQFKNNTKDLQKQMQDLAQQMQSGAISFEEGAKKMEQLQNAMMGKIDNHLDKVLPDEKEDPTQYEIIFVDTKEQIETRVALGTLHIVKFNEKEFVANLAGQHFVECLEKRAATSKEEETLCKSISPSLTPWLKVLKEENINLSIDAKLIKFDDFR